MGSFSSFLGPLELGLTAGSGILGVAQGVGAMKANNDQAARNKMKLEQLLDRERRGELGLSGGESMLLDKQLNAPVAAQASQTRARGEQLLASSGGASGADLAQLRAEQSRTTADAAQRAALEIAGANQQAKAAQKNEIEQRGALDASLKRDDTDALWGSISEALGVAGAAAGSDPGTFKLAGMFGRNLSATDRAKLSKLSDDQLGAMFKEMMAGVDAAGGE
jgi:hypothetical protein